jgi:hypothetical protein
LFEFEALGMGTKVALVLLVRERQGIRTHSLDCVRGQWADKRGWATAMLLSDNNIMAELSYAYLHAIASRAGFSCQEGNRHEDGIGVDAKLRVKERFGTDSTLTNFTVDVQLKATSNAPIDQGDEYSYSLRLKNYNELRSTECQAPQLLVVLFLPSDNGQWVIHSVERLICQRCSYWVSLRGAPPSDNETSQTVYVPKANCLSVEHLRELMARFSRMEVINYER